MNLPQLFSNNVMSVFIYGTGTFANAVLDVLTRQNIPIRGILEHVPRRSVMRDILVQAPDALLPEARAGAAVILGIHNRDANIAAIITRLNSLNYAQIITPVQLYDYFAADLEVRYWLTRRTFYAEHEKEIDAAARLFTEPASRGLFDIIMRFRRSGDYSLLPAPDMQHQYFPADLPAWKNPLRLIDCGAYTGDTLASFLSAGYEFQAVAAFEPDQENFRRLSLYIAKNRDRFPNTSLFPCGVYSSPTKLMFEAGIGEASKVSQTGTTVIQCTSLDESLPTFAPDLIKMDIEGSEMDAVLGANQLIKTYRPVLVIAVYHVPAYIWEIPLYISRIAEANNIRYTYHLRAHAHNCFENIFYAIPERSTT